MLKLGIVHPKFQTYGICKQIYDVQVTDIVAFIPVGDVLEKSKLDQAQIQLADPRSPPSPVAPASICPNPLDGGEANG
jgi:hypothetical protein